MQGGKSSQSASREHDAQYNAPLAHQVHLFYFNVLDWCFQANIRISVGFLKHRIVLQQWHFNFSNETQ